MACTATITVEMAGLNGVWFDKEKDLLDSVHINSIATAQKGMWIWMCVQWEAISSAKSEHQEGKSFECLGMI